MATLAKVLSENDVAEAIGHNARALLDKVTPMLGEPADVSFNAYRKTICLHWTATEIPVEVEVDATEFELYRFVAPTEISHWPLEGLDELVLRLSSASR